MVRAEAWVDGWKGGLWADGGDMIWFECKQCHKRHGKGDNLAGTLVFCECGQGNRVPWNSTIAEPEPTPEPARPAPSRPEPLGRGRPALPDEDQDDWRGRWNKARDPEEDDRDWRRPPDEREDAPYPKRRPKRLRRVRPDYCFNHEDDAPQGTCEECRIPFCSRCLTTLQGRTLCGPCKNFRLAGMARRAPLASTALVAIVVALVSGPVTFILTLWAFGLQVSQGTTAGPVALSLVSAVISGAGAVLGGMALRQIDRKPQTGGISLGTCAMATSAVGVVWSLTLLGFLVVKSVQG